MRRAAAAAFALALALAVIAPEAARAEPAAAPAGAPATLLADRVSIDRTQRLVAEGNVEVLHAGQRLRAARITYDRRSDALTVEGPILVTDAAGNVLTAEAAVLSADLTEGLLQSARVILDRQLQIAANEVARVGGRYTRLSRAVASSCRICATGEAPIWEIRARRVVHDAQERQIVFDDAQLRAAGLPILWLPRLRIPDPTLTRATGFLTPRLLSTSAIGTGVALPYFLRLGAHRDLTLTPLVTTGGAASLGLRYRQAFRTGSLAVEGAATTDPLSPDLRGFATVTGAFDLPRDTRLRFRLEGVSDRTYLNDYGIAERDRLESRVELERIRRDRLDAARVTLFSSLRADEDNATLPMLATDAVLRRRIDAPFAGGRFDIAADLHAHFRASGLDAIGRDVIRLGLSAAWRRGWRLGAGLVLEAEARMAGDVFRIMQDAAFPDPVAVLTPSAAVTLRWPLVRLAAGGARDVVEPVAQLAWSDAPPPGRVPNEESILVGFDEGNLFAPSRYPGVDRREGGARLNLGVQWTRTTAGGWTLGGLAGRVVRLDGPQPFTAGSGLAGDASDWLLAGHLDAPAGLRLDGRALIGDGAGLRRGEFRLALERERFGLASAWIWAVADPAEMRPVATAEGLLDARLRIADGWTARASGRYDFTADRATGAALGLEFRNECLRVDIALTRSFTAASSVGESTNIGVLVDFLGFGNAPAGAAATRRCRR